MRVRLHKISERGRGLRPGATHVCVLDRKSNSGCWFDLGAHPEDGTVELVVSDHDPVGKLVFVRFPEEADDGRYGAWVSYDDFTDPLDAWLLNVLLADAARSAARWLRESWRSSSYGPLPSELAELTRLAGLRPAGGPVG